MARVKGAMMTRKRRNKTLKLAKGYWGAKSKLNLNRTSKLNALFLHLGIKQRIQRIVKGIAIPTAFVQRCLTAFDTCHFQNVVDKRQKEFV